MVAVGETTGARGGRRRRPALLIGLALAMVAAACGSTISREEIVNARRLGAGQGPTAGAAGTAGEGAAAADAVTGDGAGVAGAGAGATRTAGASGRSAAGQNAAVPRTASDVGITPDTVVIGSVSTISGPIGGFQTETHAMESYFRDINAAGGVHGRKIVMRVIDDGQDAGRNAAAHRQLADQVFAFIGSTSAADTGGAPIIKEKAIPDIGYALSPDRALLPTHGNLGRQGGLPGMFDGMARYAKSIGIKEFGSTWVAVDTARNEAKYMEKTFESQGIHICYRGEFQLTEVDFNSHVIQMRQAGCEGFYVASGPADEARFERDMYRQGWAPPYPLYNLTAYVSNFADLAGGAEVAEGAFLWSNQLPLDEPNPTLEKLLASFKKHYPRDDPTTFAVVMNWADSITFVTALERAGPNPTRKRLLEELENMKGFDAGGIVPPFDPMNNVVQHCWMLMKFTGGKWRRAFPAQGFDCTPKVIL